MAATRAGTAPVDLDGRAQGGPSRPSVEPRVPSQRPAASVDPVDIGRVDRDLGDGLLGGQRRDRSTVHRYGGQRRLVPEVYVFSVRYGVRQRAAGGERRYRPAAD